MNLPIKPIYRPMEAASASESRAEMAQDDKRVPRGGDRETTQSTLFKGQPQRDGQGEEASDYGNAWLVASRTDPDRRSVDSLLLGLFYENQELRYVGGTKLTNQIGRVIAKELNPSLNRLAL